MAIAHLEQAEWGNFFGRLSLLLAGKRAEIEVDHISIGTQISARSLPVLGIAYDPKNDVIEIALDGVDHIVRNPRNIYVDEMPGLLVSLQIVDRDGVQQIVLLREPLMLPAPR